MAMIANSEFGGHTLSYLYGVPGQIFRMTSLNLGKLTGVKYNQSIVTGCCSTKRAQLSDSNSIERLCMPYNFAR
jgi:hypothetical protein